MAMLPISRAYSPYSREASSVAEMKTKSAPLTASREETSTAISVSPKGMRLPFERSVASSFRLFTGKRRSSAIFRNSRPTTPVAPTTATLYCFDICRASGNELTPLQRRRGHMIADLEVAVGRRAYVREADRWRYRMRLSTWVFEDSSLRSE